MKYSARHYSKRDHCSRELQRRADKLEYSEKKRAELRTSKLKLHMMPIPEIKPAGETWSLSN